VAPITTPVAADTPVASKSTTAAPTVPFAPLADVPTGVDQVVTVTAPSSASTHAILRAWQRAPAGPWSSILGAVPARIGSAGIGQASESQARTPAGTFTLTQAFGRNPDPGTGLRYFRVSSDDWWVSDVSSPEYNTHQVCAPGTCPFDESAGENLYRVGEPYAFAVVIDYNRNPVRPGAGWAFFVHVSDGSPTAGCVAVPRDDMVSLLRWLDPGEHPEIILGVG
jgi:L,D-peptidoglycan transpeptidase YkuD (ErfK/YbiS/YcfS/YnhG family)